MKFEEILNRTRSREPSQGEAASVLGVSERTFRRWRDRFEADGAEGLYDRRQASVSALDFDFVGLAASSMVNINGLCLVVPMVLIVSFLWDFPTI